MVIFIQYNLGSRVVCYRIFRRLSCMAQARDATSRDNPSICTSTSTSLAQDGEIVADCFRLPNLPFALSLRESSAKRARRIKAKASVRAKTFTAAWVAKRVVQGGTRGTSLCIERLTRYCSQSFWESSAIFKPE